MARAYTLDTQAAKEANSSKRITETGKYKGKIIAAFYEQNQNGTEMVNLMFATDDGQECGPLPMYTHNGQGQELAGYKTLNALMTCCAERQINWDSRRIELYDYEQQKVLPKTKECAANLENKRIGLVLQKEIYEKRDGGMGERMSLFAPFAYDTEMMAAEILGKAKEPKDLAKMVSWIMEHPVKTPRNKPIQQGIGAAQSSQSEPDYSSFDDDIPF